MQLHPEHAQKVKRPIWTVRQLLERGNYGRRRGCGGVLVGPLDESEGDVVFRDSKNIWLICGIPLFWLH